MEGKVECSVINNIATITFSHPKGNSLPLKLLNKLTESINTQSTNESVSAIILRSEGKNTFCAGASFDELIQINNFTAGKKFFMGFANLINAMRKCPKFIIARIQGKAVGGGIGLVASADYTLALSTASVKLSELEFGIGPFVVGPAVERKIGKTAFITMSVDAEWHDAFWAKTNGLYTKVFPTIEDLDVHVNKLANKISKCNPLAIQKLKQIFWEGTENWVELLEQRAEISGELIQSEFAKKHMKKFKSKS